MSNNPSPWDFEEPTKAGTIPAEQTPSKPKINILTILKIARVVFFFLTFLCILLLVLKVSNELAPVILSWTAMIVTEAIFIQLSKKKKE